MKLAQIDDVELISIKTKSLQDLDNEINSHSNLGQLSNLNLNLNNNKHSFIKRDDELPSDGGDYEEAVEKECDDDHYESYVRYVTINKSPNGACGFHLTRTKWDPYPWVTAVDNFTPAAQSDLKTGDCVLEVNGCDVLGLRITEIAKLVKTSQHQVTVLLWSSNCNTKCNEESLCAAPMPRSLQRLSLVVQSVLSLIECPVCLDTITPPAMQCQNGHLLCVNCRIRAEKCPVCRDRYFPRPALIAEQIQSAITSAFNLCRNEDKVRQKIFGRHNRQRQMVKETLDCLLQKQREQQELQQKHHQLHKVSKADTLAEGIKTATTTTITDATTTTTTNNTKCDRRITDTRPTCNKFLRKFFNSKAYSMENLTNGQNNTTIATKDDIFNTAMSQRELMEERHEHCSHKKVSEHRALSKDSALRQLQQTSLITDNTNQFYYLPKNISRNHRCSLTYKTKLNALEIDLNINSKLCCNQMLDNKTKHFSLLLDKDYTKENIKCLLESPRIFMNEKNKMHCPPSVCETQYATIPRAIKLKEKQYKLRKLHQIDGHADKKTAINVLKSHHSSRSSLN